MDNRPRPTDDQDAVFSKSQKKKRRIKREKKGGGKPRRKKTQNSHFTIFLFPLSWPDDSDDVLLWWCW